MSEDWIERETLIAAPLERVWSLVAEPGFWVADKASLPGMLVEFTLTPEGGKTRLRVVESGFAALAGSEALRSQAVQDNTGGWPQELDALKTRAEQLSV